MAINKVVYGNDTLMDITDTTAEETDVAQGVTFYKNDGTRATGTADYMDKVSSPTANDILVTDSSGQAIDSGVQVDTIANKVSKTGDTMTGILRIEKTSGDTFVTAARTDKSVSASVGVGSGGVNHGVYSHSLKKWIAYANATSIFSGVINTTSQATALTSLGLTNALIYKGNFSNTADINATDIAIGMYGLKGFTITTPSGAKKMYGTFIQCGGEYMTQIVTGGIDGESGLLYIRRYITGQSSWSDWYEYHEEIEELKASLPTATSQLLNDSGFITNTVGNLTNYTDTTSMQTLLNAKQDALNVQVYYYNSFSYEKYYDTDGETVVTEVQPYNTSETNADTPHAIKYGRIVNMTGSLKTVGAKTGTATWKAATVPAGCEPLYTVKTRQQASGQNSYLCEVRPDGGIYISRYGVATNIAVPNNAWLNLNMSYITKE